MTIFTNDAHAKKATKTVFDFIKAKPKAKLSEFRQVFADATGFSSFHDLLSSINPKTKETEPDFSVSSLIGTDELKFNLIDTMQEHKYDVWLDSNLYLDFNREYVFHINEKQDNCYYSFETQLSFEPQRNLISFNIGINLGDGCDSSIQIQLDHNGNWSQTIREAVKFSKNTILGFATEEQAKIIEEQPRVIDNAHTVFGAILVEVDSIQKDIFKSQGDDISSYTIADFKAEMSEKRAILIEKGNAIVEANKDKVIIEYDELMEVYDVMYIKDDAKDTEEPWDDIYENYEPQGGCNDELEAIELALSLLES